MFIRMLACMYVCVYIRQDRMHHTFLDGYCSTVQGLLDWFEVDLGFAELLFVGRGGGLGSRPIFKKFNEPYAPS